MMWLLTFTLALCFGSVWPEKIFLPYDDVKIRLYSSDESYMSWKVGQARDLFTSKPFNSSLDTIMIILGYESDQNTMIQQTVQALLSRKLNEQYNIVAVDLPSQFSISVKNFYYLRPAMYIPAAGNALGHLINAAKSAGHITPEKIDVISFSLGVHIAGYMGRRVNGLLHSITGVDPSGIGFDWSRLVTHLTHVSHEDAQFVHLYHSNSAVLGTSERVGTADYQFNSGESQPGCSILELMCSHLRGFDYYLEALRSPPGVPAIQCNNLSHLVHCKCFRNRLSYVGFPLDTDARGVYTLRTGEESPFSLGKDGYAGIHCSREKTDYTYRMGIHYDKLMHMLGDK